MGEVILFGLLTLANLICVIRNHELKAPTKWALGNVVAAVAGPVMVVYKAM